MEQLQTAFTEHFIVSTQGQCWRENLFAGARRARVGGCREADGRVSRTAVVSISGCPADGRPEAGRPSGRERLSYNVETTEQIIEAKLTEAEEQLNRYSGAENIRCIPNLRRVAAVFSGTALKGVKVF